MKVLFYKIKELVLVVIEKIKESPERKQAIKELRELIKELKNHKE